MAMTSLSDMSRRFVSMGHMMRIRADLDKSMQELSSLQAADLTRHLRQDTPRLADIDRRLTLNRSYTSAAREIGQTLGSMQMAMKTIDETGGAVSSVLIAITSDSDAVAFQQAGVAARTGLDTIIASLNSRFGDKSLFSGNTPYQVPLISADEMMSRLETAIAGATTAADIRTIVDDWFDDPAGGFLTDAYLGDTGLATTRRIDQSTAITISPRADDPVFREMMKDMALATLASSNSGNLTIKDRAELTSNAGLSLVSRAGDVIGLQSSLGQMETLVEQAMAGQSGRRVALETMRNNLVQIDPLESITAVEALETQLETHYTVTARLARLSLADYLR